MGGFIVKQPNGRYMRFSTILDCPTDWNMTKEDYIKLCEKNAREKALETLRHIQPFDIAKECFSPNVMSLKKFKKILEECEESINE